MLHVYRRSYRFWRFECLRSCWYATRFDFNAVEKGLTTYVYSRTRTYPPRSLSIGGHQEVSVIVLSYILLSPFITGGHYPSITSYVLPLPV